MASKRHRKAIFVGGNTVKGAGKGEVLFDTTTTGDAKAQGDKMVAYQITQDKTAEDTETEKPKKKLTTPPGPMKATIALLLETQLRKNPFSLFFLRATSTVQRKLLSAAGLNYNKFDQAIEQFPQK